MKGNKNMFSIPTDAFGWINNATYRMLPVLLSKIRHLGRKVIKVKILSHRMKANCSTILHVFVKKDAFKHAEHGISSFLHLFLSPMHTIKICRTNFR